MNETLLDVLLYLFENYRDADTQGVESRNTLRAELTAAGFPETQVEHAFDWLERLGRPRLQAPASLPTTLRIYAPDELRKLDAKCRGVLLGLERIGVLDADSRELVIELLMPLDMPIDVRLVKWACMLVVLNQDDADRPEPDDDFDVEVLSLKSLLEGRQRLQ